MIFRIPHTRFKSQRPPSTGRDLGPAASFGNREGGRRCWKEETRATVAGPRKEIKKLDIERAENAFERLLFRKEIHLEVSFVSDMGQAVVAMDSFGEICLVKRFSFLNAWEKNFGA
ncbi:hypothetical protein TNIN_285461 [Trichonephila inaurata madagascariensis]|uniref:Uncharacterized protein n=1 Tax=Trichonephila inaurata madagascariensis TaxID=2747483 RepID=A0A8X7CF52_9ARAC|nr:hypothetical protein TNIN_285461 [Trichonephila inaurata madagascariensis]